MEETRIQKLKKSEEGQAIVEFALVLPLLLTILCGIIDFGWMFYNQLNIDNAAREAARQISVGCINKTPDEVADQAETIVKSNVLSINAINSPGGVTVSYLKEDGSTIVTTDPSQNPIIGASMVRVNVKADMPVLTFVLQAITRSDRKILSASSAFKIETRASTTVAPEGNTAPTPTP